MTPTLRTQLCAMKQSALKKRKCHAKSSSLAGIHVAALKVNRNACLAFTKVVSTVSKVTIFLYSLLLVDSENFLIFSSACDFELDSECAICYTDGAIFCLSSLYDFFLTGVSF